MIKHSRITLRHVAEADLPYLIRAATDLQIRGEHTVTSMTSPMKIKERFAQTGFSSDEGEKLIICDESGKVIGDVVHFPAKRYTDAREIGWIIYEEANRSKGYATEAVTALVDYLFRSRPINRVECNTGPDNAPSLRMAEKCGFVREGVMRGYVFCNGAYLDGVLLSILRSEWESRRASSGVAG